MKNKDGGAIGTCEVGVIKDIDSLGRLVIPKEYRERFSLTDSVELIATEGGVLIRNPRYRLVPVFSDVEDADK